jgi:mannose-6-phosphate isomerase-like protein (cupin superfamily)
MTRTWQMRSLPSAFDERAPDGTEVRKLLRTDRASMAHFRLDAGERSHAIAHRSVEELWYVLAGEGQLWLSDGASNDVLSLKAGCAVVVAVGASFQLRAGREALEILGVTSPAWSGDEEVARVEGLWTD